MPWIFYALAAPFVWSIVNFLDKFLVEKKIRDPFTLSVLVGFLYLIIGILIFIYSGFKILPYQETILAVSSGFLIVAYLLPYFKALMLEDTSRIAPLFEITPIFVLIIAFFLLGETVTVRQFLAFPLITGGAFILGSKKIDLGLFKLRYALWLMILSDLLYAILNIFFRRVTYTADFWIATAYQGIGAGLISFILLFHSPLRNRFVSETRNFQKNSLLLVAIASFLTVLGYVFFNIAISKVAVSLAMVVMGTQSFMVLVEGIILSIWLPKIIKEDIAKETIGIKIVSIVLIFTGIYLINS